MQTVDWARWIGLPWEPPFGCWTLVSRILVAHFGMPGDVDFAAGTVDTALGRAIALRDRLAANCMEVHDPRAGDLILIRPGHIGMVVRPGLMLHSNEQGGASRIESYRNPIWWPSVQGFWRFNGP